MKKTTPFHWSDGKAEEAAKLSVPSFKNTKIGSIARYSKEAAAASGRPAGSVMVVSFKLNGQGWSNRVTYAKGCQVRKQLSC